MSPIPSVKSEKQENGQPADTQPPLVVIVSPNNRETVKGMVKIVATATDNVGVDRVEFYAGSGNYPPIAVVKSAPYEFLWNVEEKYNNSTNIPLSAVAYDKAGNKSNANIVINPSGGSAETDGPVLNVLEPQNGQPIGRTLYIQVEASDQSTIREVTILVGSDRRLVAQLKESPYIYTWNLEPQYYNNPSLPIYIRASDAYHNQTERVIIVSTQ